MYIYRLKNVFLKSCLFVDMALFYSIFGKCKSALPLNINYLIITHDDKLLRK